MRQRSERADRESGKISWGVDNETKGGESETEGEGRQREWESR